jgi:phosphate transport system substrate-binding protein
VNMTKRRAGLMFGVAALSLVAAACGSSSKNSSSTTATPATTAAGTATTAAGTATTAGGTATTAGSTGSTIDPSKLSATLNASGATFPKAYYDAAIDGFSEVAKNVTINYAGGGSGKGRQDLADQIVDWAGSDSPIPAADKAKFKGGDVLYFPTVVAPITMSVNLDNADQLKLSCQTIAKIFQRQITDWSDPAIKADNPDFKGSGPITPAVRSDSSGTTDNFSKFLDAGCGSKGDGTWTLKTGSTIQWPAGVSAGNGNGGVAQIVKGTKGAIGYVDLSDAKASGLSFAQVKNKAGKFVAPTLEGAAAAAAGATVNPDLTYFAGWADGDNAYPIAAQTWILAYQKQTDQKKADALKGFLSYIYSQDGQKVAQDVDFSPVPDSLRQKAQAQLSMLATS